MRSILIFFMLAHLSFAFSQVSCQSATHANYGQQSSNGAECAEWENLFAQLPPDKKEALQRENVVRAGGTWLINRKIVRDCALNMKLGHYFAKRVDSPRDYGEVDSQFASAYSKQIVETVRALWPTLDSDKSSLRDGAFAKEKYNLFSDPALAELDLAPLISDLIDKGSVSSEFATTLLDRPMIEVKPAVLRDLARAEKNNDTEEQIYCLTVLQKMGEPIALSKLKILFKNKSLSNFEKELIRTLITKIERGEILKSSDIEALEYAENS